MQRISSISYVSISTFYLKLSTCSRMATINKNIFGSVSGRVGNLVFRKFNGKTVVSSRPDKYKKSNSPLAISARERFAAVVKLASSVSKIPQLAEVWRSSTLKGVSPYMKILNANLALTNTSVLTTSNSIAPPGFRNPILRAELTQEKLRLISQIFKSEVKRFSIPVDIHLLFYSRLLTTQNKFTAQYETLTLKKVFIDETLEASISQFQMETRDASITSLLFAAITIAQETKPGFLNSSSVAFDLKSL